MSKVKMIDRITYMDKSPLKDTFTLDYYHILDLLMKSKAREEVGGFP